MRFEFFDGSDLLTMLVGSANLLGEQRSLIDALNVFPVPDGDTGSNMYLTLLAGVKKAKECEKGALAGEIANTVAEGALLGARGNSGVILSQILKGFAVALSGKDKVSVNDVVAAFRAGSDMAYSAVATPTEGTILTVVRSIAESFEKSLEKKHDLLKSMVYAYKTANITLAKTPEILPVLKEAGVVDAGGKGLVVVLEGIIRALKMVASRQELKLFDLAATQQQEFIDRPNNFTASITFTYCTEFIVKNNDIPIKRMKEELVPYGDSLMVVGSQGAVKVHIHSNHPGLVLECCLKYGALHEVHISNMEDQSQELKKSVTKGQKKPLGVVSVGFGEGMMAILESLGVDVIIPGGQTMNPSTNELLEAINQVNAPKVLVLPNNKNILLASKQASEMSEKEVFLVPTVSMPQGMMAMLMYNPYEEASHVADEMWENAKLVRYGEITKAARDTIINEKPIEMGAYIGLAEDDLYCGGWDFKTVLLELLEELIGEDSSIVTLYYGADLQEDEALKLAPFLLEKFSQIEFEVHYGGQPHYQLIISVE